MIWENIFGVAIHAVLASRYNLLPPANLVPPATKHQNIAAPKGFTNLVPPFKNNMGKCCHHEGVSMYVYPQRGLYGSCDNA